MCIVNTPTEDIKVDVILKDEDIIFKEGELDESVVVRNSE